jgi:hypothetical protein
VDIFEKLVTERTPLGHYSNINAEGYFMFPKLEGMHFKGREVQLGSKYVRRMLMPQLNGDLLIQWVPALCREIPPNTKNLKKN